MPAPYRLALPPLPVSGSCVAISPAAMLTCTPTKTQSCPGPAAGAATVPGHDGLPLAVTIVGTGAALTAGLNEIDAEARSPTPVAVPSATKLPVSVAPDGRTASSGPAGPV